MITEQAYKAAARLLGVDVATIKAVDAVESNGRGIINGRPVILFEPHIYFKELRKAGIEPSKVKGMSDMLYPTWGQKPYPKGQDAQHQRLQRAVKINRNAALKSCSWGRFQIMGFNYSLCGCKTLQEFINKIFKDEAAHLDLFVNYVLNTYLDDELRAKDWKGFARSYNGPLYYKNRYDTKLQAAYQRFK